MYEDYETSCNSCIKNWDNVKGKFTLINIAFINKIILAKRDKIYRSCSMLTDSTSPSVFVWSIVTTFIFTQFRWFNRYEIWAETHPFGEISLGKKLNDSVITFLWKWMKNVQFIPRIRDLHAYFLKIYEEIFYLDTNH